jgi:hypothetical protein
MHEERLLTLGYFVAELPVFAVYGIGCLLALLRWKHHPQASVLAFLAFVVLFLQRLIGDLVGWVFPDWRYEYGYEYRPWLHVGLTLLGNGVTAAALALLAAAIFLPQRPAKTDKAVPAVPSLETGIQPSGPV